MSVQLKYLGDQILVKVNGPNIDGENIIFQELIEKNDSPMDVDLVIFDIEPVEYVNSLGIAEFISIHRYFSKINQGQTKMQIINANTEISKLFHMVELGNLIEIITKVG